VSAFILDEGMMVDLPSDGPDGPTLVSQGEVALPNLRHVTKHGFPRAVDGNIKPSKKLIKIYHIKSSDC
jgi:hypothetical protein